MRIMNIIHAAPEHISKLHQLDRHIAETEMTALVQRQRILIAEKDGEIIGWLRWNLFWDNTPFMNMLYLVESHRGRGCGKAMVLHWEEEMKQLGYRTVMTSTASDEHAQHFYQKLGYDAIGGFLLPGDPYEIIFSKTLN